MDGDKAAQWLALAASAQVGRLGTRRSDDRVDLVPFVFAWLPAPGPLGRLVSAVDHKPKRHERLQRFANIAVHPDVTILVDHYEEDWSQLWWVRMRGVATEEADPEGLDALCRKYRQYDQQPPTGPMLRVTLTSVQGWSGQPIPDHRAGRD